MPVKDKKDMYLNVIKPWCKKCGICKSICPKNVIEYDENGHPAFARMEDCIYCGQCWVHCPDYAIIENEEQYKKLIKEYKLEK